MPNELDPIVGQWYVHRDKGEMFQVVAADPSKDYIEIQYFDGDVEELDPPAWRAMDIELAEPPDDWTGPFDDIEPDDLGLTEADMTPQDWREPLESIHAAEEPWQEGTPPEEWEEGEGTEETERPPELYAEEQEAVRNRIR